MSSIRTRLFPFHDISAHEKLSLYSLNQTGIAGQLVKVFTGTANPQSDAVDGYSNTAVGASYNQTYSNRYRTNWQVLPTASGDTRYTALGITEYSTAEFDENGQPLKYWPARAKEVGAVISGETVPIITKGVIGLWGMYIDQSTSPVQPGFVAAVSRSGNGTIASVDQTSAAAFRQVSNTGTASWIYDDTHVVGKWLSSLPTASNTGMANEFSAQGGYAFLLLNCTR